MFHRSLTTWTSILITASLAARTPHSTPYRLSGSSFGIFGRNATFDYIIVGAGIAGSVAASRLSSHNFSVALLEAGTFYELSSGNLSQVPFYADEAASGDNPQVDWGLVTEPQVNGRRYHYAQGKALGGSSAVNSMLYHRPTKGALDAWAEEVGDEGYGWERMVEFFERSVEFAPNSHRKHDSESSHGEPGARTGPLKVSLPAYVNPLSALGAEAFSAIGLNERPSLTNGSLDGVGWWQFTIDPDSGLRSSAATSFLTPALAHESLTIYSNAHTRRILFDGTTATGVVVTTGDGKRPFTISAHKEVLVAAGVYHSPQLLMVSGIGDGDVLKSVGVPLVKHLPGVGQNMRDSCYIAGPVYEVSTSGPSYWREPGRMANATTQFLHNASGPLTNIGLDLAVWDLLPGNERASLSEETTKALSNVPADWPLFEYSLSGFNRVHPSTDPSKHYGTIDCVLTATTSKGNMTITSPSNLDPPTINPNWLQSKTDQELAIKAYRRARSVWETLPPHIRLGAEIFPGGTVTSDADVLAAIKSAIRPIHHASASCKMGKADDPTAVVDSTGRVLGVQGLRVMDSSTFPFTPPGHPQAVVYAVAEKLAEGIAREGRELRGGDQGEEVVHEDL